MSYKAIHSKNYRWYFSKEKIRPIKECKAGWEKYYSQGIHFHKNEDYKEINIFIIIHTTRYIITFPYGKPLGQCNG